MVPFALPLRPLTKDGPKLPAPDEFLSSVDSPIAPMQPTGWLDRALRAGRRLICALLQDHPGYVPEGRKRGATAWPHGKPVPSSTSAFPNYQRAEELTERNLNTNKAAIEAWIKGPLTASVHRHDVDALQVLANAKKGQHDMSVDRTSWESALRHLYEDAYPYDATGPRHHENWVLDVLALMARVPDPRGWTGLDDAAEDPEREACPTHPFAVHPPEYIAGRLQEIDRDSAENLLLALTDDGCTLSNLSRFAESDAELRAMARTILKRYGESALFVTNAKRPGHASGTLDFTSSGWAYSPLSVYAEDYGLIVVSGTEVGMFWNFADY